MGEMVERVARAIAKDRAEPWDDLSEDDRSSFIETGRAAIEAMREPTGDMVEAVYGGHFDVYWSYESDGRPGDPADIFTAMINAALALPSAPYVTGEL